MHFQKPFRATGDDLNRALAWADSKGHVSHKSSWMRPMRMKRKKNRFQGKLRMQIYGEWRRIERMYAGRHDRWNGPYTDESLERFFDKTTLSHTLTMWQALSFEALNMSPKPLPANGRIRNQ